VSIKIESNSRYDQEQFQGENLDRQQLSQVLFYECAFSDCSFVETTFAQCRFVGCDFQDCDLSLFNPVGSIFSGVSFSSSKLVGVDWTHAAWSETQIDTPLHFENCLLNHSTFYGLGLEQAKFSSCAARDVDFRECCLVRADFGGTALEKSLFSHTDLTGADLSRARNYAINPQVNILTGAKFSMPEALSLIYNLDIELVEDGGLADPGPEGSARR
jgi:uncharacterized protein YjbI with pentapeptide repeats